MARKKKGDPSGVLILKISAYNLQNQAMANIVYFCEKVNAFEKASPAPHVIINIKGKEDHKCPYWIAYIMS